MDITIQVQDNAEDKRTRLMRFQFWSDSLQQIYAQQRSAQDAATLPSALQSASPGPSPSPSPDLNGGLPTEGASERESLQLQLQGPVLNELTWAVQRYSITKLWLSRMILARRLLAQHTPTLSATEGDDFPGPPGPPEPIPAQLFSSEESQLAAEMEMVRAGMRDGALGSLDDCDQYAERAVSSLLYASLEIFGVRDVRAEHIASHLGKMLGIVTLIRFIIHT